MPEKSIVSLFVKQKSIQAAKIVSGGISDPIEMEWSEALLPKAFIAIKDRYSTKSIRVVLDDECEDLSDTISEYAKDAGLELEVIEPKKISLSRDPEPLIGVALADSEIPTIKENDSNLLSTAEETKSLTHSLETPNLKSPKKLNKKLILIISASLILVLLIIGIITLVRRSSSSSSVPSPSPTETVIIIASPSPTPSPASFEELSTLNPQILNGSGVPGEASAVNTLLKSEGFDTAETGNAENYDYTDTIVQIKVGISSSVYTSIEKALSVNYTLTKGEELPESSDYDIVITVGQKISAE